MGKKDALMDEIGQVPEPFLDEVLDFVRFIKAKTAKEKPTLPSFILESHASLEPESPCRAFLNL